MNFHLQMTILSLLAIEAFVRLCWDWLQTVLEQKSLELKSCSFEFRQEYVPNFYAFYANLINFYVTCANLIRCAPNHIKLFSIIWWIPGQANIRWGWKWMKVTNALAYYKKKLIAAVIFFSVQILGTLFTTLHFLCNF